MNVKEQWAAAGRTTLLLPSGFRVRGVLPSPTEVIRRKLVPWQLRQAVQSMGGKKMSQLTEDQHAELVEARRWQASAFVQQIALPGSEGEDGWEDVHLSVEDLGNLPPDDIEALDDLIMGVKTADMITAESEVRLGLRDKESAERVAQEEAGDTVDGWAEFRGGERRTGDSAAGGAVEPEAVEPAAHPKSARGAGRGRRSGAAAAEAPDTAAEEG